MLDLFCFLNKPPEELPQSYALAQPGSTCLATVVDREPVVFDLEGPIMTSAQFAQAAADGLRRRDGFTSTHAVQYLVSVPELGRVLGAELGTDGRSIPPPLVYRDGHRQPATLADFDWMEGARDHVEIAERLRALADAAPLPSRADVRATDLRHLAAVIGGPGLLETVFAAKPRVTETAPPLAIPGLASVVEGPPADAPDGWRLEEDPFGGTRPVHTRAPGRIGDPFRRGGGDLPGGGSRIRRR